MYSIGSNTKEQATNDVNEVIIPSIAFKKSLQNQKNTNGRLNKAQEG